MLIYDAEKNLGLEFAIRANASIKYNSLVMPRKDIYTAKASTDNSDPLLYKITDVLVSTGWNKNQDVFCPYETWSARKTPVDKPFDVEHVESDIIGHIVACRAVADDEESEGDFKEIADDTDLAEIPNKYHLLNDSVIYKTWSDEEKIEATDKMIEEIEAGEWFVSMECKFYDFDYAVVNPNGEERVIGRTEDTAFLTRYLAAYGGEGLYVDKATEDIYKIGRLMKNIIFSGKGLVRKPANPNSVITNTEENTKASVDVVYNNEVESTNSNMEENIMSDELKALQAQVAELLKDKSTLASELSNIKASETTSKISTLETTVANLNTQLDAQKETLASVTKANTELDEKLKATETELNTLKAEKKKEDRKAKMKEAGADDEDDMAAKLVAFENLNDTQFDEIVKTLGAGWKAKKGEPNTTKTDEVSVKSSEAAAKLVDNAKASATPDPALAVGQNESKLEVAKASITEKMFNRIGKNKTK